MGHPVALEGLLRAVTRQIRRRRVEHYGLRGVFWSALVAVVVLALKGTLGAWTPAIAAAVVLLGTLAGAASGWARRVRPTDAARLADRAFGLEDRVTTALEWGDRPDPTPLVPVLVTDTVERVERLEMRTIAPRVVPREARFLPLPVLAAVALLLAPPLPMPSGRLPDLSPTAEQEGSEDRADTAMLEEPSRSAARDGLKRPAFEERNFAQRGGTGAASMPGDLSALFKDTSLASQRPDFNSFLKKGDERLKLLAEADRLPDLQSDFTTSQYKMVFRKSKALTGGLKPDQISPEKLRELLQEMERLGRKGGNWSPDALEGMDALEYGQQDRALEAMEKALSKMRAFEERERAGKGLPGGREMEQGAGRGRERGRGGGGPDDQDFGEGEGLLPGKGRSPSPKGDATHRLRATPYDVGVEGEAREGRKQGLDTNMTGRGGPMASRLRYLGVIGQYRKMMEDAITREQIPRDYQNQIKDYFQALDER